MVASFADGRFWRLLFREPVFWFAVAFGVYVVGRAFLATAELPETASLQYRHADSWIKLLLFFWVGWYARDVARLPQLFGLALSGLFLGMLLQADWSLIPLLLSGAERTGFQFRILAFALYSATVVLGLVLLRRRIWGAPHNSLSYWARSAGWLLATGFFTQSLIFTQSRSTWAILALLLPALLLLEHFRRISAATVSAFRNRGVAVIFVLGFLLVLANSSLMEKRLASEEETLAAIATGNIEQVPETSIGFRAHLAYVAYEAWLERPFIGWGPGSTYHVVKQSGWKPLKDGSGADQWFDNLHNGYLEVLVRFGLIGAALFFATVALAFSKVYPSLGSSRSDNDLALFVLGALLLLAAWNLFNFRLVSFDGRAHWLLVSGSAFGFYLQQRWRSHYGKEREF